MRIPLAERLRPKTLSEYVGPVAFGGRKRSFNANDPKWEPASLLLGGHQGQGKPPLLHLLPKPTNGPSTICRLSTWGERGARGH